MSQLGDVGLEKDVTNVGHGIDVTCHEPTSRVDQNAISFVDEVHDAAVSQSNRRRAAGHPFEQGQSETLVTWHDIRVRMRVEVAEVVARDVAGPEENRRAVASPGT